MSAPQLIWAFLSLFFLTACGGAAQLTPQRLLIAIDLNNQAVAALARGEYPQAERLYLQSLAHDRSIENADGIAINLIGLAVTYQKAHRLDDALRVAALVNENEISGVSQQRLAEAELLRVTLLIRKADWDGAATLVGELEARCAQRNCQIDGRLANIKAQLAIVGSRIPEAATLAQRAIQAAETANNQEELANALRVAANVSLYANPADGIELVDRALRIDKDLALSEKIFKDLVLLGRLYWALGLPDLSAHTYSRARRVAEGDKNSEGLREVSLFERELGGHHEK